jgi:hypothetical protein
MIDGIILQKVLVLTNPTHGYWIWASYVVKFFFLLKCVKFGIRSLFKTRHGSFQK